MAFDAERARSRTDDAWRGAREQLRSASYVVSGFVARLEPILARLGRGVRQLAIVRFVSASLTRRIIVSNLFGLLILLGGYLYLSQYKGWLIAAKRESLGAQGEIIAAAIAANATLETERIVLDPDKLPELEGTRLAGRGDGFAALELSVRPEKVTPVLRKLMQNTTIRARIYDRGGKLITDSADLLTKGQISDPTRSPYTSNVRPKTKNVWTRMTEYFFSSDLPVYKEIGRANGNYYPEVRAAMTGTATPMLLLNEWGEQIVSYAVPIRRAQQVHGVLLLSTAPGEIDAILDEERMALFKVALLALLATIAASLLLSQTVAGPMRRLSAAAENVSRSINARQELPDFSNRRDEVGQLAGAFAAMTNALYRRIEASEKFAADVAHELKNPLTAARSTAESLAYAKTEEQRVQLVQQIQHELKRLNRLITDVSNASRLDAELALQESEPVELTAMLSGIVSTFRDIVDADTVHIKFETVRGARPGEFVVSGHEGRLWQVVTNLMDNAVSFSPKGGTVTIKLRRDENAVEFSIEDEGPGIEADKLETIFERFYTYRPTATGSRGTNSGLGLSISRDIVVAHGGKIWAENRYPPGQAVGSAAPIGARFIVRLPPAVPKAGSTSRGAHRIRRA
ncbi:MAG TPA: stimulus-sensing domain-containing protein [Hyphomicrobiaceae bacterium]|nr:stimulus-sensing domain-containing protein [Hyphomicrobiaceae bacterium]